MGNCLVLETKGNTYKEGFVSSDFFPLEGKIRGPIRRTIQAGAPYKHITIWNHNVSVGEIDTTFINRYADFIGINKFNVPDGGNLIHRLIGNSKKYLESGNIRKFAILELNRRSISEKINEQLDKMVADIFSYYKKNKINEHLFLGELQALNTSYSTHLRIVSQKPLERENICIGTALAAGISPSPHGEGCGPEVYWEYVVDVFSPVKGTEYIFDLRFERN